MLGLAASVTQLAISPALAAFYKDPRVLSIAVVLAILFPITALGVQHDAILRRQLRFVTGNCVDLVRRAVGLGIGILVALKGGRFWSLVIAQLATAAMSTSILWCVCHWRPTRPHRGADIKSLVTYSGFLSGFRLTYIVAKSLDTFLIGRFIGSAALGYYSRASTIVLFPIEQIMNPISAVSLPILCRLTGSPERFRRVFLRVYELIGAVTLPGAAFLFGTSGWIVALLLGPKWESLVPVMKWLAPLTVFSGAAGAASWVFMAYANTKSLFFWSVLNAGLILLAISIGMHWGVFGVAVSFATSGLLLRAPLLFYWASRNSPIQHIDFYRPMWPHAICAAVVLFSTLALKRSIPDVTPWVGLTLAALMSGGLYAAIIICLPSGRRFLSQVKDLSGTFGNEGNKPFAL
jgi:PST family polysaccharide transporter